MLAILFRLAFPKGSVDIDGGYSEETGWHGEGHVTISWAKQQERQALISKLIDIHEERATQLAALQKAENKAHGSVSVGGGYSESGGWHGDVSVSVSWAKAEEERQKQTEEILDKLIALETDEFSLSPANGRYRTFYNDHYVYSSSPGSRSGGPAYGNWKGGPVYARNWRSSPGWADSPVFAKSAISPSSAISASPVSNIAIPPWVINTLKFLLEEFIKDVVTQYRCEVFWDPSWEGQYKACIISLVHTQARSAITEMKAGQTTVEQAFKNFVSTKVKQMPVHLKFAMYNGNPSAIIYW